MDRPYAASHCSTVFLPTAGLLVERYSAWVFLLLYSVRISSLTVWSVRLRNMPVFILQSCLILHNLHELQYMQREIWQRSNVSSMAKIFSLMFDAMYSIFVTSSIENWTMLSVMISFDAGSRLVAQSPPPGTVGPPQQISIAFLPFSNNWSPVLGNPIFLSSLYYCRYWQNPS